MNPRSIIALLFLVIPLMESTGSNSDPKIKILFRYDDYRLIPDKFTDSLFYVFQKNKIPLCIGLIPFDEKGSLMYNLSPEQLAVLKERMRKNEIELALHGYNHLDNRIRTGVLLKKRWASEFANADFKDQFFKIKKGKTVLDSLFNTNISIFIPPYNSYDNNTLKVLDSLRFNVISASIDGPSGSSRISYMPYTTNNITALPEIISSGVSDDLSIIVVIHQYSFEGMTVSKNVKPIPMCRLDTILRWINRQPGLMTTSFTSSVKMEVFNKSRLELNSTNKNMVMKILNQFEIFRYGIYNTNEYLKKHRTLLELYNILFHMVLFAAILYLSIILNKLTESYKSLRFLSVIVFIILNAGLFYKAINSHSFRGYLILMLISSLAFYCGMTCGERLKSRLLFLNRREHYR